MLVLLFWNLQLLLTVRCGSSTKTLCAQSAQCWWVVRCGAARGSGFSAFETGASYRFQEQPCALALVGALHDNYNPLDSPSMRVYRLWPAKNVKIWNFLTSQNGFHRKPVTQKIGCNLGPRLSYGESPTSAEHFASCWQPDAAAPLF